VEESGMSIEDKIQRITASLIHLGIYDLIPAREIKRRSGQALLDFLKSSMFAYLTE
jgi:hypothetical protein